MAFFPLTPAAAATASPLHLSASFNLHSCTPAPSAPSSLPPPPFLSFAFLGASTPKVPLRKADGWVWSGRQSSPHKEVGVLGTQVFLPSHQAAQSQLPSRKRGPPGICRWGGEQGWCYFGKHQCDQVEHLGVFSILVSLLPCPLAGPARSRAEQVFPMGTVLAICG